MRTMIIASLAAAGALAVTAIASTPVAALPAAPFLVGNADTTTGSKLIDVRLRRHRRDRYVARHYYGYWGPGYYPYGYPHYRAYYGPAPVSIFGPRFGW